VQATILDGSREGDALTESIRTTLLDLLQSQGWDVQSFILQRMDIRPCAGCFGCWIRTPGRCVSHDSDDIARAVVRSDLLVFLTPVIFGGYSAELKKAVDHLIVTNLPFFRTANGETHHKPRYHSHPNLLVVGTLPQRDAESETIFATLGERNSINMFSPAWAVGVITPAEANGVLRQEMQALLSKVEVV